MILKHIVIFCIILIANTCIGRRHFSNKAQPTLARNKRQADAEKIQCSDQYRLPPLDNIVGIGWDNLQNLPTADVFEMSFKQCRHTSDHEYIVPDNAVALRVKESRMDHMASFYEDYRDYSSSTSDSINTEFSVTLPEIPITIGGSFGYDHQEAKKTSATTQSSMLRTSFFYHAYTLLLQPDSIFDSNLKERLLEIGRFAKNGSDAMAAYLAQMLVRDYGTHVITSAKVGAEVSQIDYVDTKAATDQSTSMTAVRAAASLGFQDKIKITSGYGHKDDENATNGYKNMLRHSRIKSKGALNVLKMLQSIKGPEKPTPPADNPSDAKLFSDDDPDSTGSSSEKLSNPKVDADDVVALDRSGELLYHLISDYTLPELSYEEAAEVAFWIRNATVEYFNRNMREGCTDPRSKGFDFRANYENRSDCSSHLRHNYALGGFYESDDYREKKEDTFKEPESSTNSLVNGIVGYLGCPDEYEPLKLAKSTKSTSATNPSIVEIRQLSWCRRKDPINIPDRSGYMFGGAFVDDQPNPITGSPSCPGRFIPLKVLFDLTICVSRNYDMDAQYAVDLGGFFSCRTLEKSCLQGYTNYLAVNYSPAGDDNEFVYTKPRGCELYYCVKADEVKEYQTANVEMPPYVAPPRIGNGTYEYKL